MLSNCTSALEDKKMERIVDLLQETDIEVDKDSAYSIVSAKTKNGRNINAIRVVNKDQDMVSESYVVEYLEIDEMSYPITVEEAIAIDAVSSAMMFANSSTTLSRFNVTVTCTYSKRSGSGGYMEYKPISVAFVSSVQQYVKVVYSIRGWVSWSSNDQGYQIPLTQAPASAGQYYSVNSPASSYYRPQPHRHNCEIITRNDEIILDVTTQ